MASQHRKNIRLSLDLPIESREKIEDIKGQTDAKSMAEVFRNALSLYDYAVTSAAKGGELLLKVDNEVTRILLLEGEDKKVSPLYYAVSHQRLMNRLV